MICFAEIGFPIITCPLPTFVIFSFDALPISPPSFVN